MIPRSPLFIHYSITLLLRKQGANQLTWRPNCHRTHASKGVWKQKSLAIRGFIIRHNDNEIHKDWCIATIPIWQWLRNRIVYRFLVFMEWVEKRHKKRRCLKKGKEVIPSVHSIQTESCHKKKEQRNSHKEETIPSPCKHIKKESNRSPTQASIHEVEVIYGIDVVMMNYNRQHEERIWCTLRKSERRTLQE